MEPKLENVAHAMRRLDNCKLTDILTLLGTKLFGSGLKTLGTLLQHKPLKIQLNPACRSIVNRILKLKNFLTFNYILEKICQ